VVDVLVLLWVKYFICRHGIVKDTSLGDFLGLEALVFRQVLAIVVSEMVVGDNAGNSDATTNQKVAHNSLESGLP
jgi:hypothetical protein